MAAPMFANLTSFLWARLARGRPKVRFIWALQTATMLSIAAIAFLPIGERGQVGLALLVILSRCLQAGVLTLRSIVWRMNYPRHIRGQITSRLVLLASTIYATAPLAGYLLLDWNVQAFRIIYPVSALIAMIGVIAFSRVRLRGERELLRYERQPAARPQPHGTPGPIYEYDPRAANHNFWTVLRHDHHFRSYMLWQFFGGAGNMMGETVVIYMVANMADRAGVEAA